MRIHTFSIVAHCAEEEAWGVAVASKFPAVGAVVPWARAGAGAVATQSYAKMGFGPDGLALMGEGLSADEALSRLLQADDGRETRQVALVDARGAYRRRMPRLGRSSIWRRLLGARQFAGRRRRHRGDGGALPAGGGRIG